MPRKKITEPEVIVETPEATSDAPVAKPKRSRNPLKKLVETMAASVGLIEAPAEEPEAKPKSRRKPKAEAVAAPVVDSAPVAEEAAERPAEAPSTEPVTIELSEAERQEIVAKLLGGIEDTDMPLPTWRTKGVAKKPSHQPQRNDRRKERPQGKGPKPQGNKKPIIVENPDAVEVAEAPAPPPEPPKPKRPPKPVRPIVNIPADAPQVVVRQGVPLLTRDHVVYPPLIFFGNPADETRAETVFAEVKLAAEAGINLVEYMVDFDDQAGSFAAYLLSKTLEINPLAQVLFRLNFISISGWQSKFPDAAYRLANGSLAEPSVCDDAYWNDVKGRLANFVQRLLELPSAKNILGVHLDRSEWFYSADAGYDSSHAALLKFRDWAGARYNDDEVSLRASWFNGSIDFENISIPRFEPQGNASEQFVRSGRKQRSWVDYHLFLSDATMERIADLAYCVKEASKGMMVVAVNYGYTFEWSSPASGHLSLGKLLRTPEVDIICGPPSYAGREPGSPAPYPGPISSFALNGKLFISEEDFKTSIGTGKDEVDDYNPMIKTPQDLESVHLRGLGAAQASGCGITWMDMWGNGWLKTAKIWDRAKNIRKGLVQRMATQPSDPEVIVFIDERALAYLVDPKAFTLLVHNVRDSVMRSGLSFGFYLLSDLAHREVFPEAKLYIFVNAWDMRPELRAAIKQRLQRKGKLLFWLYTAGLFDSGREALERAREITGIALKPQPFSSKAGTTILNKKHPLCEIYPERSISSSTKLEPTYFAIPENAIVLGEYSQTGLPSFVVRDFKEGKEDEHWTSVFLGEPIVTPALVRALGIYAGAHVFNYQDDVVHANLPFLTIHCSGAGQRTVALPKGACAYDCATKQFSEGASIKFSAIDGSTHSFLIGERHEIEALVDANEAELLHLEELPYHDLNEARPDTFQFDVPLMRLDEWMEGQEDTDVGAEEWLLRPKLSDIEATIEPNGDEPGQLGSRRRKRRNNNNRNGKKPRQPQEAGERGTMFTEGGDDVSMNVVFRNRD